MNKINSNNHFNYFDAYASQVAYAKEMASNLVSALKVGQLGSYNLMTALHTVENDADAVNHKIQDQLLRDFVVPMERGSMAGLAHALDDVCDAIEQIAIESYMRKLEALGCDRPLSFEALVQLLEQGTVSLYSAVELLKAYDKRRNDIKQFCVQVQTFESQADEIYIESVRALYEDYSLGERSLRVMHELFNAVENAIDTLEDAAEKIESIVTENV